MNGACRFLMAVAVLCLSLAARAQEVRHDVIYPACPPSPNPFCMAADFRSLLRLQTSGGDIRLISDDSLLIEVDATGHATSGIHDRIFEGIRIPPILDEVVRIEFDVGLSRPALCTGVALNRNTVLTAGHCACAVQAAYRVSFPRYSGKMFRAQESEFHDPRKLSRPPLPFLGYDCRRLMYPQPGKDLGLLFLEPSAAPSSEFDPVAPPAAPFFLLHDMLNKGELRNLLIFGYGRREDQTMPHDLIGASTPIRDPFCLRDRYDGAQCGIFREFTLSSLVTEVDPGADTCDGDSGGPVYFIGTKSLPEGVELHRMLVGITSRGLGGVPQFGQGYCGGGGVYTAVAHPDVLKWLAVNGVPLEVGLTAKRFAEKAFVEKSIFDQ
ncbi:MULTISPECIES: trypsin-like serine protease [unclassified Mesorhizobium]|uniref:trypsin-like serine protease n=1 Tax=unclassified Mesorhizobium TaxID=325217 RepID=UPI002417FCAC|nr:MULTISPECIES: trypsin-like serine protease [unclassified Mesorhizobium]WFP61464.1 trypsin-like serine protease [Mesorhizobium sp. WSM4904]WFP74767.1 trypsin-like serine protease [Mesorhizobium sp. WSM4906]